MRASPNIGRKLSCVSEGVAVLCLLDLSAMPYPYALSSCGAVDPAVCPGLHLPQVNASFVGHIRHVQVWHPYITCPHPPLPPLPHSLRTKTRMLCSSGTPSRRSTRPSTWAKQSELVLQWHSNLIGKSEVFSRDHLRSWREGKKHTPSLITPTHQAAPYIDGIMLQRGFVSSGPCCAEPCRSRLC